METSLRCPDVKPRSEFDRIAFLVRRDGPAAARAWVVRTLAIYHDSVCDPKSHAADPAYRPLFENSMREFREWLAGERVS